ncbi:MAG TPA: lytic transglycosylase domain-containing protein [Xanthobacteraceae bacterium]|jgi:soluble lytic murein transglycosylase|nr:lytic transglycosylase domain-containing protein [Xanthobacteraceae bacterium]
MTAGALAGALALSSSVAAGAGAPLKQVPLPRPRPHIAAPASASPRAEFRTASLAPAAAAVPKDGPALSFPSDIAVSKADLSAVKEAIDLARRGKTQDATAIEQRVEDPVARKLIEWEILRSDDNTADFSRYRSFIAANPGWPSLILFRKRAEAMLWQERADLATIRAFTGDRPITGKGRFALGRALLAKGDRAGAQAAIRDAWRTEPLTRDAEEQVLATFGDLITRADDKARMNTKLYANENETGMRAAQRLGGAEPDVAKARIAVSQKAGDARALLDALPDSVQNDPLVILSRIQELRRADKIAEAAALMLKAPRDPAVIHDANEWWIERRLVARKLLDIGDFKTAYQITRDAATPARENYRIDQEFTAGWIALRFLNDPALAAQHFARIGAGITNPISLARAGYWRGRAAEALGRTEEARAHYETAARYSTAYYGQLARAKLGLAEIVVAPPPLPSPAKRAALTRIDVVRAAEILYAIGERDLVIPIIADLAERTSDIGTLVALAELATHHDDARSVLLIGKTALGRGYAFDRYAFPTFGLPRYSPIAPEVDKAVVYAIARQESAFNPRDVSSANALGLMQVTPEAGRYIAKKFNVRYDQKRLLHDDVYNMQIGTAELYDTISGYRGSYILAFAGYNAGRGRVREWVERYGDPRDPNVDPVDWVERIPFSETRNYVQRIIENIQVYRARFGSGTKLLIEADLRRGGIAN